jgi:hypothetical protein
MSDHRINQVISGHLSSRWMAVLYYCSWWWKAIFFTNVGLLPKHKWMDREPLEEVDTATHQLVFIFGNIELCHAFEVTSWLIWKPCNLFWYTDWLASVTHLSVIGVKISPCQNNPSQLMGNLLANRRRCKRSNQNTSWRHFSSVDEAPRKKIVYIFLHALSTRNKLAAYRLFIRKSDGTSRTLRLMYDGISFDKILPKEEGYFGIRNHRN